MHSVINEFEDAVPEGVKKFADRLIDERRLPAAFQVDPFAVDDPEDQLSRAFQSFADVDGFEDFLEWGRFWMRAFGEHVEAQSLTMKLVHARQPMCPRFHTDNVRMRFIAALSGPGSEWLSPESVKILPDGSISQDVSQDEIRRIGSGSVGYFKGTAGEPSIDRGVVHRSPNVVSNRVVLTMDIVS